MLDLYTKIAEYDGQGIYLSEDVGQSPYRKKLLRVASIEARNKKVKAEVCVWPRQGDDFEEKQYKNSIKALCEKMAWSYDIIENLLLHTSKVGI